MAKERPIWVQALLDRSIRPTDYRLFAYLFWRQGQNGSAWPSQPVIARDLGLSERAIRNSTGRLRDHGYIQTMRIPKQGRGHKLAYSIGPEAKGGTPVPPLRGKRRQKMTTKGGTNSQYNTVHRTQRDTQTQKPKPKKVPKFISPTVAQVREYAESRGYPDFDAERFIEYYAVNDWHDKNGDPVRNWKQKMLSVWLKDKPKNDELMMTDEEFREKFPNEEALQRYEQIQRERYGL